MGEGATYLRKWGLVGILTGLITRPGLWGALETAKEEPAGRRASIRTEVQPSTPNLSV
jgi:hypothetical protein